MNTKDIYLKGRFLGQYSARKDHGVSFSSESYYNIHIDAGHVLDFEIIDKKTWELIEGDALSQQNYLQNVKCLPIQPHDKYTGYKIQFTKVKVANVNVENATALSNGDSVGDITCDFYGFIQGAQTKKPKKTISKPQNKVKAATQHKQNYTGRKRKQSKGGSAHTQDANGGCFLDGCISAVGVLMVLFLFLISTLTLFQADIKVFLGFLVLGVFVYLLQKEESVAVVNKGLGCLGQLFSVFGFGLILVGVFSVLLKQCGADHASYDVPPSYQGDDETTTKREVLKGGDSLQLVSNDSLAKGALDTLITHRRVWYDFNRDRHEIEMSVKQSDVDKAYRFRERYNVQTSNMGDVYRDMAKHNDSMLIFVYKALDKLRHLKALDDKAFLEAIITLVQDIPYRLVLSSGCSDTGGLPQDVYDFLTTCSSKCCLGHIRFGFQSPAEFVGNLYGDCDTRTVLLYTLLKHYNYDVVIINSKQYAHSILGIHSKYYSGTFIKDGLKKYYFIETTHTGFYPGVINNRLKNINFWDIVTH